MSNEDLEFRMLNNEIRQKLTQMSREARVRMLIDRYTQMEYVSEELKSSFLDWLCNPADMLIKEKVLEEKFMEL